MAQLFQNSFQDRLSAWRWVDPQAQKHWHVEYLAAVALGLLILIFLVHPAAAEIVILAAAAAIVLPWAVYRTSRHPSWLLLVMVLIEAVAASSFISDSDEQIGAFVRYPLGFLFIVPFLPALWKSDLIRKGGFRDYGIYMIWAMISASYSILPEVSFVRSIAAILPFCAICVIAMELSSGEDARRAMGVLLAGCGIVVAVNYLARLFPAEMTWQTDPESGMIRFAGFFSEPNELGGLALTTLGAGFCYWPVASGWKKGLAALTILAALVECVMADSRSPLIAIAIGCAVYLVFKYRFKGVIALAVAFAIFYCTAEFAVPGMRAYMDRGDVASFTGRQVAWDFAVRRVKDKPIIGYGYEVEGEILTSPYFPGWDDVWNMGYRSSLHDGYVSRAVGLGVPAMLFWLFITLRPAISCFFRRRDPWRLRSIAPLALLPVLILNSTESISDFRAFAGILMALAWAILERQRLIAKEQAAMRARAAEAAKAPMERALQAGSGS